LTVVAAAPASARLRQVSGTAVCDTTGATCAGPPAGYADYVSYPPILLSGGLQGCWYTRVATSKDLGAPSGIYLESGQEVFVGRLDGGSRGVFTTTYKYQSKWAPDVSALVEVWGRCEHPIVTGSGRGGFAGATGRVNFQDVVANGSFVYRGHITTP